MPPGSGQITAIWVTAAAVGARPAAVFHLRPGDARDRRRRSDPHWLSGPELRITAFGRTRVDTPEGHLRGEWLQQRPGQLLKYLISERNRVVPADVIAETLWPGTGRQGLGNVRYFMHALREKLEPHRPRGARSSFIVTVQGGYALDRRHVRIDADDFDEAISQGLEAASRGDDDFAVERLRDALALYRGDFLADEPYAECTTWPGGRCGRSRRSCSGSTTWTPPRSTWSSSRSSRRSTGRLIATCLRCGWRRAVAPRRRAATRSIGPARCGNSARSRSSSWPI